MSAPAVLFIAVGANRRRAVAEDSRTLVEAGGRATVLLADRKPWAEFPFAAGVRVLSSVTPAGPAHWPVRAEQLVLFRAPRAVLHRLAGRGSARAKRVVSAYERRVANRVHRRVFQPAYARFWGDRDFRQFASVVRGAGPYDALVVCDPDSFPVAQRLLTALAGAGGKAPRVAYRIDQLLTPAQVGRTDEERA